MNKEVIIAATRALWESEVNWKFPLLRVLPSSKARLFLAFAENRSREDLIGLGTSSIGEAWQSSGNERSPVEEEWHEFVIGRCNDWPFLPLALQRLTGRRFLQICASGGRDDPRCRIALETGFDPLEFQRIESKVSPSRAMLRTWVKEGMGPQFETKTPSSSANWHFECAAFPALRAEAVFGGGQAPLSISFLLRCGRETLPLWPAFEAVLRDVVWDQLSTEGSEAFLRAMRMIKENALSIVIGSANTNIPKATGWYPS